MVKLWTPQTRLHVRLHKVTENRLFYTFFFRDPVNHFIQSMILPKTATWEMIADLWDVMHKRMQWSLLEKNDGRLR